MRVRVEGFKGDFEIELEGLEKLIPELKDIEEIEIDNLEFDGEILLELLIPLIREAVKRVVEEKLPELKLKELEFPHTIREVVIGNTEKGTRKYSVKVGGKKSIFEIGYAIALDVFDTKIKLPKAVRDAYGDLLNDPIEQAKAIEEKKMADLIAFHMISIDVEGREPSEAVKTLKRLLDEVGMPIVVGGCGDVKKDVALFKEVAKVCKDEGVVLNSATLESADEIGKLAKESGSAVISWVQLDINQQKQLNKSIAKYTREIIMDTTTAGFGYGTEYSFTTMERIRLAGLKGDEDLAYPIMTAGSNAWGCREAWMKDTILDETTWGDRMIRGPIWEIGTSLVSILAGADLVLNLHPKSAECLQKLREEFKVVV